MKKQKPSGAVERLFPFVLRARILLTGRETLLRRKGQLHFVLITTDLSQNSLKEILREYAHYPVVQRYTSSDLETFFHVRGAKVIGFKKSDLAQSIYGELKEYRLNRPPQAPARDASGEGKASGGESAANPAP